ncbi:Fc receptor-like protein 2 isoform X1 [Neovison vison]|uniref:Fc receptor-like protein 2 isoform X1 n=1 Tax=Neovison vison TaxID=452646 RepID=UPI001CF0C7E9|nr:Fc receptor-like protein 2 isoform X1 [Neogale vison]
MLLWSLLVIFGPLSEEADWLTLDAPSVVFEGDSIDLMCQKKKDWWEIQTVVYYRDGKQLQFPDQVSSVSIPRAAPSDSGQYSCSATAGKYFLRKSKSSRSVRIEVLELFPRPVLTVSSYWPTEGSPVTLTCETRPAPQRSNVQLQFCFFRDGKALGSGWSSSPALRVPAMWTEDSGSYWCQAETATLTVRKQSLQSRIHVQRVPVSNVSLEIWAPRGPVIEGGSLVLLCSVAKGTGNITFSWHREATRTSVGRKTQRSLSAELEVPAVQEGDAGRYYCRADNGHDPVQSQLLSVCVRSPVSHPVLTLRELGPQAGVGDVVELHCEAQRGSPPILYQFYHENVTLANISVPSGGGASFNLSLTTEHSGNYSCEADNGLGARRSEVVPLNVTVPASHPILTVKTPRALAVVGDMVELRCEAQRGSPPIRYRYYHEDVILGTNSAPSGGGASFNLSLTAEHSGNYACEADNSLGAQRSEAVKLSVTVPVSRPILTLNLAGPQAVVGDLLELRCEVQRGSPPILYWFYHEDVILGNTSAPSGRGASFNLSLTTEHSGNYSCGADNGLGVQRSYMVTLNFTGLSTSKVIHITVGVIGCLLSVPGLAATAYLVSYFRTQRKSGRLPATGTPSYSPKEHQEPSWSGPCSTDRHKPPHSEPPAVMEPQPVYSNARSPRTHQKNEEPAVIYSELKKAQPEDTAGQAHEDPAENYENLPCAPSALDH